MLLVSSHHQENLFADGLFFFFLIFNGVHLGREMKVATCFELFQNSLNVCTSWIYVKTVDSNYCDTFADWSS